MRLLNLILLVMFSLVLATTSAEASDFENVSQLGRWAEGPCLALEAVEGIAYFGNGAILEIVDFHRPNGNVLLSRVSVPGPVRGVGVVGGLACVANGSGGLRVIDVSDPAQAFEIGVSLSAGCVEEVALCESHAYLAAGEAGMRVVDISDPASPFEVGYLDTPGYADDIMVTGGIAYLAAGSNLRIIDVSSPTAPVEIGFFPMASDYEVIFGLDVVGNQAYVVTQRTSGGGSRGLRIIDVSDPVAPFEAGFLDIFNEAFDVSVIDGYAFVAAGISGLRVIAVSDPAAAVEVGFVNPAEQAIGVEVSGHEAYVASGHDGLIIIDIEVPTAPNRVDRWDTHGSADLAVATGDFVYLNLVGERLHILDVSDAGSPVMSGAFVPETLAYSILLEGPFAYVLGGYPDLRIFDLSIPGAPVELSSLQVGGSWVAVDIAISGDYAYLPLQGGHSYTGMQIVDISDPTAPFELGYVDTSAPRCVAAGDGFAYLGDWNALWIIDASDPENPQVTSTLAVPGRVEDIVLEGENIYMACSEAGLHIANVSDPYTPLEVSFLDTPGKASGVGIGNGTVYVADGTAGLRVIDVTDPTTPVEVGYFDTHDYAGSVYLDRGRIYIADRNDGLYILQNDLLSATPDDDLPGVAALHGVHPNPFNPMLSVDFSLNRPEQVRIGIFNLAGNRIAVISDRLFETGTHSVRWNGRDSAGRAVSSGVYLVRMDAAGSRESLKVTLVR